MFISPIDRPRPTTFLLLLLAALAIYAAPWRAAIAVSTGELMETCRLADGGATVENAGMSCCWPGWGCMFCASDTQGNIIEGSCYMRCSSSECANANAGMTTGNPALPQSVKNPEQFFGESMDTVAPPKIKTPKLEAAPGADTVQ